MPQQQKVSTENNFIAGLKTDFTALNFPENAATETFDCIYTVEGDVLRRQGFDLEEDYVLNTTPGDSGAVITYVWKNAGGDGDTIVVVLQVGTKLYFYKATDMLADGNPLSATILASTVDLTTFSVALEDIGECQFTDGNGYLFVFNETLEPFYCRFESDVITATAIDIKIRDFKGIPDNEGIGGIGNLQDRPLTLTDAHKYNLLNQGWTQGSRWEASFNYSGDAGVGYLPLSWTGNGARAFGPHQVGGTILNDYPSSLAHHTWTVPAGLPAFVGQQLQFNYTVGVTVYNIDDVDFEPGNASGTGTATVLSYSGTTMEALINSVNPYVHDPRIEVEYATSPFNYRVRTADSENTIDVFFEQCGIYPSNTDVWFTFKEVETINTFSGGGGTLDSERFHPGRTISIIVQPVSQAPAGHFILEAFNLDKSAASGIVGLTVVDTDKRPRTGAWYAGRVFYAGADDAQAASGTEPYYTWTENIYFSQIIEDNSGTQFGKCHQFDDPTDEKEFNLLATDGGVITIQGCGSIYKMFAIQNGILVFAANGVWFITGSQGVGFSATDYTVTKISGVRTISASSFVDVNGLPFFWNEEAIYAVQESQHGSGVTVEPITLKQIDGFYEEIPYQSKLTAKGSYDPVEYVVSWLYDDDPEEVTEYIFTMFDDSCHLWSSSDMVTFGESVVPPDDGWEVGAMSQNDGDYDSFLASGADNNYGTTSITSALVQQAAAGDGWVHSTIFSNNPSESVAFSTNTNIIFIAGDAFDYPPEISLNGGTTWTNLTPPNEVAHNHPWWKVCMSRNAEILYAGGFFNTDFVIKSTDLGANWTSLTVPSEYADFARVERLACSADGDTIVVLGYEDHTDRPLLLVSTNGGTSWDFTDVGDLITTINPGTVLDTASGAFNIDMVSTPDGSNILVGVQYNTITSSADEGPGYNAILLSTDTGDNWTMIDNAPTNVVSVIYGAGGHGLGLRNVGISPDGNALMIVYEEYGDDEFVDYIPVDMTTDGGASWIACKNPIDDARPDHIPEGTAGFTVNAFVNPVTTTGGPEKRVLNYRTTTKAWYPWIITSGDDQPEVYDIKYVQNPGGIGAPDGIFKFATSIANGSDRDFTFSECSDTSYQDWDYDDDGTDYESYFLTGFKLHGQAIRKWQPEYLQIYSRNEENTKYNIQGVFGFGSVPNSGRWSSKQLINIHGKTEYGMWTNKIRIRGSGLVTQLRVSSVTSNPFDIMGWAMMENQNANV